MKSNKEKPSKSEEDWFKDMAHLKWPAIFILIIILLLIIFFQIEFKK